MTASKRVGGDGSLWFLKGSTVVYLQLDAGLSHGSERVGLPVDLLHLLPHDHVEAGAVLVAEDEAGIVVVSHSVHMKRPFKVDAVECGVTCDEENSAFFTEGSQVSHIFCCVTVDPDGFSLSIST